MPDNGTPACRLSLLRAEEGLKPGPLADLLGVTADYVSSMTTGKREVTSSVAQRAEEKGLCRARWLLHGEGPKGVEEGPSHYGAILAMIIIRQAYHCGECYGQVARGRASCPHCGARVTWPPVGAEDGE